LADLFGMGDGSTRCKRCDIRNMSPLPDTTPLVQARLQRVFSETLTAGRSDA
jgi:hypothetical protein